MTGLRERFMSMADRPAEELIERAGTLRDYAALASHHYLSERPATATRVLVLEHARPTVAGRYLSRSSDRCVVGVLVESYPSLCCRLRDEALGGRYAGWKGPGVGRAGAGRLLNEEVRCISRVVVDPQWRGLGLAVRLVRRAIEGMTTPYLEALAAMGRVHPFFERAGMTAYRRAPLKRDQRLLDALRSAGVEAWELANVTAMHARLTGGDGSIDAALLRSELRRWAGASCELPAQLTMARQALLCEPVYYLKARESERD